MRQVTMATRDELVVAVRERYANSERGEKTRILDEFVAVTGFHRKYANRVLCGEQTTRKPKGYSAPIWITFKQALDLGGCVRKGEKGSLTVYADTITRTETDSASGEEATSEIHYMKGYTVFNVAPVDGLPDKYYGNPAPRLEPLPRIERAEAFFRATGADIRHGGDRAYYAIGTDHIQMPPFEAFRDAESYYAACA